MHPLFRTFATIAAAILAAGWSMVCAAAYTFTAYNYPGSSTTQMWGINASLNVCGNASFAATPDSPLGFVYSTSTMSPTLLPPPAGGYVTPIGINDAGTTVGSLFSPADGNVGFIYDGSSYITLSRPGSVSTVARAINNGGRVTGYYEQTDGTLTGFLFDLSTGIYTDIGPAASLFTLAQGINTAGQVVGSALMPAGAVYPGSPTGQYGWVRQPGGALTLFRVNGKSTRARGLNDGGTLVGWIADASATDLKSFKIAAPMSGGYVDITVAAPGLLVVPGATQTIVEGINNAGYLAGNWSDAAGNMNGFYATPPIAESLNELTDTVNGYGLPRGTANSLLAKVRAAQAALASGDTTAACSNLQALINYARAQSGHHLTVSQANEIIAQATAIRASLGCP